MMTFSKNKTAAKNRRGDTVIEVVFATTIFGLIAVISISLMNSGISTAQSAVELTLARNEIDAQAEALRFIQNGFAAERENEASTWQFDDLWDNLTDGDGNGDNRVYAPGTLPNFHVAQESTSASDTYHNDGCANAMANGNMRGAFVLNTRRLTLSDRSSSNVNDVNLSLRSTIGYNNTDIYKSITNWTDVGGTIIPTPLYPRIIYTVANDFNTNTSNQGNEGSLQEAQDYEYVLRSEGLWVQVVQSAKTTLNTSGVDVSDYFDFHIRACWYAPASAIPSTIGTVVRLYNPRVLE